MFDHIGFAVSDYARSKAFYDRALAPLDLSMVSDYGTAGGYGRGDEAGGFWIASGDPLKGVLHVAFSAKTRAEVDAFYAAAIAAGGRDNGGPGIRTQYSPTYYAAFVFDPDGHNVEAVCHAPA